MTDSQDPIIPRGAVEVHMFLTRRAALALECQGMKHSRRSVYALCKQEYGLKGSKESVLHQMNEIREHLMEEYKK